ncbi:coq10 [[Candida] subhashii]|uniref:Coq10 n=1 Tax=[Candida] subhashii TaxID=561895 RepID=A0A8J5UIK8_9ASCO|nr:coq10 [[Candida] subhashii]KAG7663723.1 coq10 [[Candida] subhashii]
MLATIRPSLLSRATTRGLYVPTRSFFGSSKPQEYQLSKILNGTPNQLYNIVSEVSQYQQFVPFVEESYISQRCTKNTPTRAGLQVGWKDITERFECVLTCHENKSVHSKSIQLDLFEDLETKWVFNHIGNNKCKVDFTLTYKFKNPIYDRISFMFAPQVSEIMIKAFEKRLIQIKTQEAKEKYSLKKEEAQTESAV